MTHKAGTDECVRANDPPGVVAVGHTAPGYSRSWPGS